MPLQDTIVSVCELLNFLPEDQTHPVKIELRGMSLNLRAKLPSKSEDGKSSMQRISLGIKADKPGLKSALQTALKIQEQLKNNSFQWRDYDSNYHSKESIEKSLDQFKEDFFNDPKRQTNLNATNATWISGYAPYLNRLRDFQKKWNHSFNSELYSLRHAWAIRSIHHGLNPSIASKMMGHSVEMHTKTYHYYLSKQDMDKAYSNAVG